MNFVKLVTFFTSFLILFQSPGFGHFLFGEVNYDVAFKGISNKETIALLKTVSQLVILEEHPPSTTTGLRRRAEADVPNLIQGLHSLAYYEGKVDVDINLDQCPILVTITITTGPVYTLSCFNIEPACKNTEEQQQEEEELESCLDEESEEDSKEDSFPFDTIAVKNLGIIVNKPALPKTILDAENALIHLLARKGRPLAEVVERKVVADYATKTVSVTLRVDSGPEAYFGSTTITGHSCVQEFFIRKKIYWREGSLFNPCFVDRTQAALEASGLFSSATIKHADELDEDGFLPMEIDLIESRLRTIGVGASYNTQLGPGGTAEWEHRNMRGLGEKLRLRTDIWQKLQRGMILYGQPDFACPGQDLLWVAEAEREITKGFTEAFFSFSGIINRKLNENLEISYGGTFKQLDSENSDNNGSFSLVKIPGQIKWSTANNLLDPTRGKTLNIKLTPTCKVNGPQMTYFIQNIIATAYRALDKEKRIVLAGKVNIGSIFGATDFEIPPPERFYAGSENTLRGYQFLTVSPLDANNKPIGGRSLMIYSLELRARVGEKIGLVAFYDIGNVYASVLPSFYQKVLQSLGCGFRYHTPVGPLRLDLAFPLNRRPQLDKQFQVYFSIGQAF